MGDSNSGVGQRLAQKMKSKRFTQRQLSLKADVSRAMIGFILKGKREPTWDFMAKLAPFLDTSAEYLMTGNDPLQAVTELINRAKQFTEVVSVGKLGAIPAGYPWAALDELITEQVYVTKDVVGDRDMSKVYALEVRGQSLEDEGILDGDTVLIEVDAPFEQGKVYVVWFEGVSVLRKVYRENGRARLVAANKAYRDISAEELVIQGKVFYSQPPGRKH